MLSGVERFSVLFYLGGGDFMLTMNNNNKKNPHIFEGAAATITPLVPTLLMLKGSSLADSGMDFWGFFFWSPWIVSP